MMANAAPCPPRRFRVVSVGAGRCEEVREPRIDNGIEVDLAIARSHDRERYRRFVSGFDLADDHGWIGRQRAPMRPAARYPIRMAKRGASGCFAAARSDAAR